MRSDKDFITFLKEVMRGRRLLFFLGVFLLVLALCFFGGGENGDEEKTATEGLTLGEMCARIDGVGECLVTVVYEDGGERVYSVAVVCEGADDIRVRAGLTELITKLYGIGANRVGIIKLKK